MCKIKYSLTAALAIMAGVGCFAQPITPFADRQTKELYRRLQEVQGHGVLFGHHFTNVTGQDFTDWAQTQRRSDVKTATGDYPAVFGFDFNHGFSQLLPAVINAGKLGAIVTISYHMNNPLGEMSAYAVPGRRDVAQILPGGPRHAFLLAQLDSVAMFADRARVNGQKIPIIFRPWHEHTGEWFWWGTEGCSEDEFNALWRFTIEYLRDVKRVDNMLYVFSPAQPADRPEGYAMRNPGAEYYDIAGFDCYRTTDFAEAFARNVEVTAEYAARTGKIAACAEFGWKKGLQNCSAPNWYTESFLSSLRNAKGGDRIVYALTWGNRGAQWWVPLKGQPTYPGFIAFYNDPYSFFLQEWKKCK